MIGIRAGRLEASLGLASLGLWAVGVEGEGSGLGAQEPAAPAPAGGGTADLLSLVLMMVLFFGIFYFFLIRPERRRRRQHQELLASLKRGDKVITIGGICGTIKKVDKDRVWLEVEDGVTLKLVKDSIVEKERPS